MTHGLTLEAVEEATRDARALAFYRIGLLDGDGPGFPALFLSLLRQACEEWLLLVSGVDTATSNGLDCNEKTASIRRVLEITAKCSSMDQTLKEELAHEGLHLILSKIIKLNPSIFETEEDQDAVMGVQEMACEIAALAPSFPMRVAPFSRQELSDRLPLIFSIGAVDRDDTNAVTILINQVKQRQSSQADVGFLMWPSAVVLSRYLVTNFEIVVGKSILELGAGCGLTGLVAGELLASRGMNATTAVLLTDFNKTVVKNCERNILLNGLENVAKADELDFYKQDVNNHGWVDSLGTIREQVDLILAADIICQPEDAFAAARTMFCALKKGGKAIIVCADSKHRFGVERLEEACNQVGLRISSTDIRDFYAGRLLTSNMDMEKTTGYVEDMSLTMYCIDKS